MASSLKLIGRILNQQRISNILRSKILTMGSSISVNSYSSFKDLNILNSNSKIDFPKKFTNEDLKEKLTDMQYYVTQEKGTERPFSGENENLYEKSPGVFSCVVCDQKIFESKAKFESGTGWPSFYDVISQDRVKLILDNSYGMKRIEVVCSGCGAHMGHVFNDGPKPTGIRYCINSASLSFEQHNGS